RVLAGIGESLRMRIRDTDLAARIGGDEFAVVLPHTDLAGSVELAEAIRATIERGGKATGPSSVTASAGVAVYPTAATEEELLAAADRALYVAEGRGRNCVATSWPDPAAGRYSGRPVCPSSSKPRRTASAAASPRVRAPSLRRTEDTWWLTVLGERKSCCAMSPFR